MAAYQIRIPRWRPTLLDDLVGRHWAKGHRRKDADKAVVRAYATQAGVPRARCRRRVRLTLVLSPRHREPDPDNVWKSLLDALVYHGLLVDDSDRWAEVERPVFVRGSRGDWGTLIELEDLG